MSIWRGLKQALISDEGGGPVSTSGSDEQDATLKPLPKDAMIIIALRNIVLFPGVKSPLSVGRASSVAAAQEAARSEQPICFLLQHNAEQNEVAPDDVHWVGTAGQVVRYVTAPDGAHHLVVQGQSRVRILEFLDGWPFMVARVATVDSSETMTPEIEARFLQLKGRAAEAIQLLPNVNEELAGAVQQINSSALLADMVANLMDVSAEEKQTVLERFDIKQRLDLVLDLLGHARKSHVVGRGGPP